MADTIACPHCGEHNRAVDTVCWACDRALHPAQAEAKAPPRRRARSFDHRHALAALGACLVVAGEFAPALVTQERSASFFQSTAASHLIVLAMAVAAVALAFANQFRYLWAAGAISLGFVLYYPYQINRSVQEAMARFQEQYPGVEVSVDVSGALAWHMGSGLYIMVAGAVLVLVAAFLDYRSSTE